jgi:hypothetical protein
MSGMPPSQEASESPNALRATVFGGLSSNSHVAAATLTSDGTPDRAAQPVIAIPSSVTAPERIAPATALKENIEDLGATEAEEALQALVPVKYNYKADKNERHVGFIAEDVPDLVASKDRKTMSPMNVVAVLTKAVQELDRKSDEQQKIIQEQQKTIAELKSQMEEMKKREK